MSMADLYDRSRRFDRQGVLVRQDAVDCGVEMADFDRTIREHRWQRPFRGTALVPGVVVDATVLLRAAALSIKPPVAVDRWSAAWLYGSRRRPTTVPMLVVPGNRQSRRRDVVVRRTSVWSPEHVRMERGIPVLTPGRLVVDLAHQGQDLRTLRDLALSLRLRAGLRPEELRRVVDAYERHSARELVEMVAATLEAAGSESGLEHLVRTLLEEAGLPPDDFQVTVEVVGGRRRLDIVYGRARVGIEVQSVEYHSDRAAMTRDARKRNAVAHAGEWLVLVVTPSMLVGDEWQEFVSLLRDVLARRGG